MAFFLVVAAVAADILCERADERGFKHAADEFADTRDALLDSAEEGVCF